MVIAPRAGRLRRECARGRRTHRDDGRLAQGSSVRTTRVRLRPRPGTTWTDERRGEQKASSREGPAGPDGDDVLRGRDRASARRPRSTRISPPAARRPRTRRSAPRGPSPRRRRARRSRRRPRPRRRRARPLVAAQLRRHRPEGHAAPMPSPPPTPSAPATGALPPAPPSSVRRTQATRRRQLAPRVLAALARSRRLSRCPAHAPTATRVPPLRVPRRRPSLARSRIPPPRLRRAPPSVGPRGPARPRSSSAAKGVSMATKDPNWLGAGCLAERVRGGGGESARLSRGRRGFDARLRADARADARPRDVAGSTPAKDVPDDRDATSSRTRPARRARDRSVARGLARRRISHRRRVSRAVRRARSRRRARGCPTPREGGRRVRGRDLRAPYAETARGNASCPWSTAGSETDAGRG